MTELHIIESKRFKLDGGAMFGVVPKSMWNKLNPADENNMCSWALRSLLIKSGDRVILIDAGMGDKQSEKFMSHFGLHGDKDLISSIQAAGFSIDDITDVFLTHLHFDHVGGAVKKNETGELVPTFPNALYWTCKSHYESAVNPNERERASFLKENFIPLEEHGVLRFIDEYQNVEWIQGITVKFAYGHTHAMMMPVIPYKDSKVVYCADLLPSFFHIRMPYVMCYDIRPLKTMEEKRLFFDECIRENYTLFLEHDPINECCKIVKDDHGRYGGTTLRLSDI